MLVVLLNSQNRVHGINLTTIYQSCLLLNCLQPADWVMTENENVRNSIELFIRTFQLFSIREKWELRLTKCFIRYQNLHCHSSSVTSIEEEEDDDVWDLKIENMFIRRKWIWHSTIDVQYFFELFLRISCSVIGQLYFSEFTKDTTVDFVESLIVMSRW